MNTYKLNSKEQAIVAQRIKEMRVVLEEVPTTLEILLKLITEHNQTVSTAEIDEYHQTIQQMTRTAIDITRNINRKTAKLLTTGDQINKYLTALDEHIANSLAEASTRQTANLSQKREAVRR